MLSSVLGVLSVLLFFDWWLPLVAPSAGPTTGPVVIEAQAGASAAEAAGGCYNSLEPVDAAGGIVAPGEVVTATQVGSICPRPGLRYIAFRAGDDHALVGYDGEGHPAAWRGSGEGRIIPPLETITADVVVIGQSLTNRRLGGPLEVTGNYRVIKMYGDTGQVVVNAAQNFPLTWMEELQFGVDLRKWIKRDPAQDESVLESMSRYGFFYTKDGRRVTSPDQRGCGVGDGILWNALGPVVQADPVPGVKLILFGGIFDDPADRACMGEYTFVNVATLMTISSFEEAVDNQRSGGGRGAFAWLLDGAEHQLSWEGFDWLDVFAFRRAVPAGTPATAPTMFFVIPEDFLDLSCSFLGGVKVCAIEQRAEAK